MFHVSEFQRCSLNDPVFMLSVRLNDYYDNVKFKELPSSGRDFSTFLVQVILVKCWKRMFG